MLARQFQNAVLILLVVTAAAVLGAYFVLYPNSRIRTLTPFFPVDVPAWIYLGGWFLYQFFESNYALIHGKSGGSGVAFFTHVGGFLFGLLVAIFFTRMERVTPRARRSEPHHGAVG